MKISRLRLGFSLLVFLSMLTGCNLPAKSAPMAQVPTYTPQPTYTMLPTYTRPAPATSTPLPPTEVQVTDTPAPTATATVLYSVQVTFSPTPTPQSGVWIRIRNRTPGAVNLYRYGRSGELHFLGWLESGYYAEFHFPDLGDWRIKYCARDQKGNSYRCKNKMIHIKKAEQEITVP